MAQLVVLALWCSAATPQQHAPATAPSARSAAQAAIDEILGILRDASLSDARRAERVREASARHLDFDTLARLSLGPALRSLTPAQQAEFTAELRAHVLHIATRYIRGYDQELVTITSDRPEANGDWTVFTRITRKPDPDRPGVPPDEIARLDFRLRRIDGRWKAIDLIIQHISLAGTFRAQFSAILKDGGVDRLLQLLRDKNAASERAEKAESPSTGKK